VVQQGPFGRTRVTILDASVDFGTADIVFSSTNGAELILQNLFVFDINAEVLVQSDNTGGIDLSSVTIEVADISLSDIIVSCDCDTFLHGRLI
jgi:hypothetical protein